jgi:arsenite-transporting ATPase
MVVDTAPTGHTLRLLELPESFAAVLALLDAMQEKHRFMVRALTHRYRADDVDRFIESMRSRLLAFRAALADPERFAVVLVTRAETLVVDETARYAQALARMGLAPRAVVVNALALGELDDEGRAALDALEGIAPGAVRFTVPLLDHPPEGLAGIERWGASMEAGSRGSGGVAELSEAEVGARAERRQAAFAVMRSRGRSRGDTHAALRGAAWAGALPRVAPLTIVAGKGGVGKTSVACALAIAMADRGQRTLVVSTDPAPSISDALAQPVGDEIEGVAGVRGLSAQQLDASAAFARFRERYRERVDELFDALLRGSMDAAHDRHIARELLALAPPGIDELYALAALGERLAEEGGRFATIIVDPAPTGHLLRLLELPRLALDWSHRLLRLMLAYREIVPLGEAAEELLAFARRTRALEALLLDGARAGVLVVALDEPLVRNETTRLVESVGALGVTVSGVLWNRVAGPALEPLPAGRSLAQFESAIMVPAPRGVDALREWSATWRSIPIGAQG